MSASTVDDLYYRGRLAGPDSLAGVFRTLLPQALAQGRKLAIFADDAALGLVPEVPEALRPALLSQPREDRSLALVALSGAAWLDYRQSLVGQKRAAIVNFEARVRLPLEWQAIFGMLHVALPSSRYSAEICRLNRISADAIALWPHAIETERLLPLATRDRPGPFTVLVVCANHARKRLERCLAAFSAAFPPEEDARMIVRAGPWRDPPRRRAFEIDTAGLIAAHADPRIEWIASPLPSLEPLYARAHALLSLSAGEGFGLPLLEALAAGCLVIAPRYGGPLDFLSDENALLVQTAERATPREAQYLPQWALDADARDGDPDLDHAVALLRRAFEEYAALRATFAAPARASAQAHAPEQVWQKLEEIFRARGFW